MIERLRKRVARNLLKQFGAQFVVRQAGVQQHLAGAGQSCSLLVQILQRAHDAEEARRRRSPRRRRDCSEMSSRRHKFSMANIIHSPSLTCRYTEMIESAERSISLSVVAGATLLV